MPREDWLTVAKPGDPLKVSGFVDTVKISTSTKSEYILRVAIRKPIIAPEN